VSTIYLQSQKIHIRLKLVFQRFRPNAAGRDLSAPERRQTRSFLARDAEGCSYEAVGPIFMRNDAQGAAGETVCATGRRWRGNIFTLQRSFFISIVFSLSRLEDFKTSRLSDCVRAAAPKTHEFHAFDATGEKRTHGAGSAGPARAPPELPFYISQSRDRSL